MLLASVSLDNADWLSREGGIKIKAWFHCPHQDGGWSHCVGELDPQANDGGLAQSRLCEVSKSNSSGLVNPSKWNCSSLRRFSIVFCLRHLRFFLANFIFS